MIIAIDTRWAEYKTGVYRVIVSLFSELIKLPEAREHEFVLFGVDIFEEIGEVRPSNVRVVKLVGWKRKMFQGLWKFLAWPNLSFLIGKVDLVHFTNFVSVVGCGDAKKVVTVHDMAWRLFPETIERKNLKFLEKFCESSVLDADMVHCVSENTAFDVVKLIDGVDMNKVKVVYNACDEKFVDLGISNEKYVLFVGTLEPRKNLNLLLSSMEILWERGCDVKLMIVGSKGWNENLKVSDKYSDMVIFPGFVSDDELIEIYNKALVFVFPSKYEGFGIPILEALACGTPVICADNSSLREIGGNDVSYFNDGELVDVLDSALDSVLNGDSINDSVNVSRLERFSWKSSAKKMLDLYIKCGNV